MTLVQGQNVFKGDWIEAYKRLLGEPESGLPITPLLSQWP
jgi:hypothetical protein